MVEGRSKLARRRLELSISLARWKIRCWKVKVDESEGARIVRIVREGK
ncbi:hypothetical protein TIFTF001_033919 [Ficus carica]|uniref:Uncharacterized protein n=1 Tax=Ficus carica TaxID=3494 RepID=A0AA88DYZ4_FICCA|nr:hypothetical protein TIFTF001_033919 [Ficus carica]